MEEKEVIDIMAKNEKVFIALAEIIANPKSYASYQDEYLQGPYWCNMHSDAGVNIAKILESAGVGIRESFFKHLREMPKKSHSCCTIGSCSNAKELLWLASAFFVSGLRFE